MEFPENDQLMFWAEASDDDRYLVVSIVEGTENKNRIWVYPIIPGDRSERGKPIKIIDDAVAAYHAMVVPITPLPSTATRIRPPVETYCPRGSAM